MSWVDIKSQWGSGLDQYLLYGSAEPSDEAEFRAHASASAIFWVRLVCSVVAASCLIFWPSDLLLFRESPAHIEHFALIRFWVLCANAVALLLLSRSALCRRHPSALLGAVMIACAAAAGFVFGSLGGLEQPWFYHSYVVLALTVVLAIPLPHRFLTTLAVAVAWSLTFFLPFPANMGSPYLGSVLLFQFFVVSFTTVVGHFIYHLARRTYYQERRLSEQTAALAREQALSEALLLNVLPAQVAEELKLGRQPIAERFDSVTVLFADICGFTPLSQGLSAKALVTVLNQVFSAFDALSEAHGVEKIKTLGDAYMAASGLPEVRDDHAQSMASMALEMIACLKTLPLPDDLKLEMRIGIATGPVVAGVIGTRRFIYDLWGDTVNMASRMESHGLVGRIHITQSTADALDGAFDLEARGPIQVKGLGEMTTYFLNDGPK